MQSTGHSSMHARSSTSTQGKAMMYVTPSSSSTRGQVPICGTRLSIADPTSIAEPTPACDSARSAHRQLGDQPKATVRCEDGQCRLARSFNQPGWPWVGG